MDVRLPDGTVLQNIPDGMSKADLVAKLKTNGYDTSSLEPAAVVAGKELNSMPRQIGLTARYGLEGLANSAQLITEPLRYVTDKFAPDRTQSLSDVIVGNKPQPKSTPLGVQATKLADWLGLPQPQGANERVVADATRMIAGTGGFAGLAGLAPKVANTLQFTSKATAPILQGVAPKVAETLAANPLQQLTSAAGAGFAGGASREAGGSPMGQAAAALVGGVAGGKAADLASGASNIAKSLFNRGMTVQDLDIRISNVLNRAGVDYSQIPERIRQSLRSDMASSLRTDKELNPEAVSRLLDFKRTNTTPTLGMVSQNPVQITKEMNLAKMAANSSDDSLHGLPMIQNQNNAKLIENLNTLGANRGDTLSAGERVVSSVLGTQSGLRNAEQSAWDLAKSSPGYKQPISSGAISDINSALGDEGLMPFMNPAISKYMEAFQTGHPFTPQDYRNLQSMLAREVNKGGNEGAAASLAQRVLLRSDLKPAGFVNGGNLPVTPGMASSIRSADAAAVDSIGAVNAARNATRTAYNYEDSSPLVRSVLSGGATSDPQRIAQRFVIGGTANEAEHLLNQLGPNGLAPIKDAILTNLKSKALSGAADETGKFSQSAFNKALNDIGERKLSLLFTPDEITALRANGRVAALMQSQPVGSAVNNSNSGALILGKGLDFLRNLPVAGPMVSPAVENIRLSLGNRAAANYGKGLLVDQPKTGLAKSLILPGIAAGGLLASP